MHTCVCAVCVCTWVHMRAHMCKCLLSWKYWKIVTDSGWRKLRWSDFFLGIKEFLNLWTHKSCDFIIKSFTRFRISLSNMRWFSPLSYPGSFPHHLNLASIFPICQLYPTTIFISFFSPTTLFFPHWDCLWTH